jgi:hypothetical protein
MRPKISLFLLSLSMSFLVEANAALLSSTATGYIACPTDTCIDNAGIFGMVGRTFGRFPLATQTISLDNDLSTFTTPRVGDFSLDDSYNITYSLTIGEFNYTTKITGSPTSQIRIANDASTNSGTLLDFFYQNISGVTQDGNFYFGIVFNRILSNIPFVGSTVDFISPLDLYGGQNILGRSVIYGYGSKNYFEAQFYSFGTGGVSYRAAIPNIGGDLLTPVPSEVPEPSTILLCFLGILGIVSTLRNGQIRISAQRNTF